jgi:hypothetical protein
VPAAAPSQGQTQPKRQKQQLAERQQVHPTLLHFSCCSQSQHGFAEGILTYNSQTVHNSMANMYGAC